MVNNMQLEWGDKSLDYLAGEPLRTRVVLKNEDGAYYPVFFSPDAVSLPDSELFAKALQVVYEKNFSQKAEQEKFQAYDALMTEMKASIQACNKATELAEAKTDKAVSELTNLIMNFMSALAGGDEEEGDVDSPEEDEEATGVSESGEEEGHVEESVV